MKIAVTGAAGFVGKFLVPALVGRGHEIIAFGHGIPDRPGVTPISVGDMSLDDRWRECLDGVEVVVHLAGYAHDLTADDDEAQMRYRQINVELTEQLARESAKRGVRRFVFMSSVKTVGECSPADGTALDESTPLNPEGAYAQSKADAEARLAQVSKETGLEIVILRPPLVYGPGVKANMKKMVAIAARWPLFPAPGRGGKRSFIYVGNLVDAVGHLVEHKKASGETYMVTDHEDKTAVEMILALAQGADRRLLMVPIPDLLIRWVAAAGDLFRRMTGCSMGFDSPAHQKLTAPLRIDSSKIRHQLGWSPPCSMEAGLIETMRSAK